MRLPALILALILLPTLVPGHSTHAQKQTPPEDQIVIYVIQLDYANAENLAAVLAQLLSPEGRVVAYTPTNSLIVKDKASVVKRVVEITKGPTTQ